MSINSCIVGVCEDAPSFSGITRKYRKPSYWSPLCPCGSCLQCNCSSGLGLLIQEAVALLMIMLKCPLPGWYGPK